VEGKGEAKERYVEVGRLKGQGREKEWNGKRKGRERERKRKGKGNGKERERKGKVKGITLISAVSVRFETVSKYRNKPKLTETNRKR
jgi:hypothetical protein